jgi:hypothetical protein
VGFCSSLWKLIDEINALEPNVIYFFLFQVVVWVDPLDGTKEFTDGNIM